MGKQIWRAVSLQVDRGRPTLRGSAPLSSLSAPPRERHDPLSLLLHVVIAQAWIGELTAEPREGSRTLTPPPKTQTQKAVYPYFASVPHSLQLSPTLLPGRLPHPAAAAAELSGRRPTEELVQRRDAGKKCRVGGQGRDGAWEGVGSAPLSQLPTDAALARSHCLRSPPGPADLFGVPRRAARVGPRVRGVAGASGPPERLRPCSRGGTRRRARGRGGRARGLQASGAVHTTPSPAAPLTFHLQEKLPSRRRHRRRFPRPGKPRAHGGGGRDAGEVHLLLWAWNPFSVAAD